MSYRYSTFLLLVISLCSITSCTSLQRQTKVSLLQGIVGQVFEQKGNKMPQVGKGSAKGTPFPTRIYVFEPALITQATQIEGLLFKNITTRLIGSYPTDDLGKFKINLTPGNYTVVVGYEDAYFTPYLSSQNELSLVRVTAKNFTNLEVIINAKASY